MFWKKRTYSDSDLGDLKFQRNEWSVKIATEEFGELYIDIAGNKNGPFEGSLSQAKILLSEIKKYVQISENYIRAQELDGFMDKNDNLVFDGFFSEKDHGSYIFQFGLESWDDALILVYFKNESPHNISLGD